MLHAYGSKRSPSLPNQTTHEVDRPFVGEAHSSWWSLSRLLVGILYEREGLQADGSHAEAAPESSSVNVVAAA